MSATTLIEPIYFNFRCTLAPRRFTCVSRTSENVPSILQDVPKAPPKRPQSQACGTPNLPLAHAETGLIFIFKNTRLIFFATGKEECSRESSCLSLQTLLLPLTKSAGKGRKSTRQNHCHNFAQPVAGEPASTASSKEEGAPGGRVSQ